MKSDESKQIMMMTLGDTAFRFNILISELEEFYLNNDKKAGWEACKTIDSITAFLSEIRDELACEAEYRTRNHKYLYYVSGDGDKKISEHIKIKDLSYLDVDMLIVRDELKQGINIIDKLCDEHELKFVITGGYMPLTGRHQASHMRGRAFDFVVNADFDWFIKIICAKFKKLNKIVELKNHGKYIHIECYETGTKSIYVKDSINSQFINCSGKKRGFEAITANSNRCRLEPPNPK